MIWVAWRTQRAQLVTVFVLVAAAVAYLLIAGDHIAGANAAVTRAIADHRCRTGGSAFCRGILARQASDRNPQVVGEGILYLLPCFIGLLVGSPILARELADGTGRLVFTQSVPRWRWLAAELLLGALVVAASLAVLVPVAAVWSHDVGSASSRVVPVDFDQGGIVLVAYALGAFGIAAAIGGLVRRQAWAFAVASPLLVAIRFAVYRSIRTHLVPLLSASRPASISPVVMLNGRPWVVTYGYARKGSDQLLSYHAHVVKTYLGCFNEMGVRKARCPVAADLRSLVLYHSTSQYWALQLREAAIFIVIAASCCALLTAALSRLWVNA